MKKYFLFFFLLINAFISINNKTNFLKLFNCIGNSEKLQKTGESLLKDFQSNPLLATLTLYDKLSSNTVDMKKCMRKSNESFEYDVLCVLKCLNTFPKNYDYSCFGSCYY